MLSNNTSVLTAPTGASHLLSLVLRGNNANSDTSSSIVNHNNPTTNNNSSSSKIQQLWDESVCVQPVGDNRTNFPRRLHGMLEEADHNGTSYVVSWQPHGRSFRVHYPKDFIEHIMPKVFRQSKWSSFQRQLNLYGFMRITDGPDKGAYYHPKFLFYYEEKFKLWLDILHLIS